MAFPNHARSAPLAPQMLADHFSSSSHNNPRSFSSNHRPGASPPFSRKLRTKAEIAHNSLPWTILQGTSLFSRFHSAHLSVNSRKQGFCLQNTGGGGTYHDWVPRLRSPRRAILARGDQGTDLRQRDGYLSSETWERQIQTATLPGSTELLDRPSRRACRSGRGRRSSE